MQLVLISGLSGSGKSIALHMLEDGGYYSVDNLPAQLLVEVLRFLKGAGYGRVAVAVDMRSGETVASLPQQIAELKGLGVDPRLIFLEAKTETLVKRFSETRRRHPLSSGDLTLPEAIQRERQALSGIADIAHRIDTSELLPNALRAWIRELVAVDRSRITLLFESFAFRHGVPLDADLVFDVRCLPNPHYDPLLRPLTGRDAAVVTFLEGDAAVGRMYGDILGFVERWLPCFIDDNRSYLTVAIGCTGGRHRSVYFVQRLARHFRGAVQVLVRHRELESVKGEG
ncbi:MAG TPA: RNase adapter RapZ [Burkholderiales bacterium]|nr:RNase adapter RapZ [Burkholderiales bacterium]